jgi:hypothetical protein
MNFLEYRYVPCVLLLGLTACTQPKNSQDLREKTAQTTAEMKRDAKAV